MVPPELLKSLDSVLGPAGFKRTRKMWVRVRGLVSQIIWLNHSNFGERNYLEFGVIYDPIYKEAKVIPVKAHLVARAAIEKGSALDKVLESPSTADPTAARVVFESDLLPMAEQFFARFESEDQLREIALSHKRGQIGVLRDLMEWANGGPLNP